MVCERPEYPELFPRIPSREPPAHRRLGRRPISATLGSLPHVEEQNVSKSAIERHLAVTSNDQKNDARLRASTRVSALGPFVSKPYDSRYSTRKSCQTQQKK